MSKSDCALSCLFNDGSVFKMGSSSLTLSFKSELAVSIVCAFSQSIRCFKFTECWQQADFLFFSCSLSLIERIRFVFPIYAASQSLHCNRQTTPALPSVRFMLSLNGNKLPIDLGVWKATLKSIYGKLSFTNRFSLLAKSSHFLCVNGRTMNFFGFTSSNVLTTFSATGMALALLFSLSQSAIYQLEIVPLLSLQLLRQQVLQLLNL